MFGNAKLPALKKFVNKFCREFGLNPKYSITTTVTADDVRWYTIVNSPDIEVEIYLDNFEKTKANFDKYFKKTVSAIGRIEKKEVAQMERLYEAAASNKHVNFGGKAQDIVWYLSNNKKALTSFRNSIQRLSKAEVESLPFLKEAPQEQMEHEMIHQLLAKNGIIFRYPPLTEGICVYLHQKFGSGLFYHSKDPLARKYKLYADFFRFMFEKLPQKPLKGKKLIFVLKRIIPYEKLILRGMHKYAMFVKEEKSLRGLFKNKQLRKVMKLARRERKELKREVKDELEEIKLVRKKEKLARKAAYSKVMGKGASRKLRSLIERQIHQTKKELQLDTKEEKQDVGEEKLLRKEMKNKSLEIEELYSILKSIGWLIKYLNPQIYSKIYSEAKDVRQEGIIERKENYELKNEKALSDIERKTLEELHEILEEELSNIKNNNFRDMSNLIHREEEVLNRLQSEVKRKIGLEKIETRQKRYEQNAAKNEAELSRELMDIFE